MAVDDISGMMGFDPSFENFADTSALQRQDVVANDTISGMMQMPASVPDFTGGTTGSSVTPDFTSALSSDYTASTTDYSDSGAGQSDVQYGDFSPRSEGSASGSSPKSKSSGKSSIFSGGKAASIPSVSGPKLPPISVTQSSGVNRDYSGILDELLAKYRGRNIPNFNF